MSERYLIKARNQSEAMRLRSAVAKEFPDATITTSWSGYTITTTAFKCVTSYIVTQRFAS
ncbi:hypothetical protein AAM22_gp91 [Pantoea phage vB_PagM_AAM22]|nr:hypothetical protein AAM22_gp91 [Pantoea phage vB_PagM_AAM22]